MYYLWQRVKGRSLCKVEGLAVTVMMDNKYPHKIDRRCLKASYTFAITLWHLLCD